MFSKSRVFAHIAAKKNGEKETPKKRLGHHGRRRAHLPSRFEVLDAEGRVGCGIAGSTSPCRETGKAGRGSRKKSKNKKADSSGNRTRVCTVAGYYSTTRPTSLFLWAIQMPRPIAHIPLLRQERDHSTRFRVACSMITTRNPRIRYRVFLPKTPRVRSMVCAFK